MKKLTLPLVLLCCCAAADAQVPAGYYKSLEGKKEGELKTAVCNLVKDFTSVSSYNDLPEYFRRTDSRLKTSDDGGSLPDGTLIWWDMYASIPVACTGRFGTYMNREHSFPKSWWGGSDKVKAYTDLNHLYPAEARANQAKSNYPLGEVNRAGDIRFDNGMSCVGSPVTGQGGGCQMVFEPDDEYKGDFARTYFYMVTTYQNLTWATNYDWMMSQNLYPTLTGWAQNLLLRWSREDPVSEKEVLRNEAVYKIQTNRNPFIDHPELAEYIWGNKKGQAFTLSGSDIPSGDPTLVTPVKDMTVDFNQVAVGNSVTSQLFFKGSNLTGTLDLILTGADKNMFTLGSRSIPASLVNSETGYRLDITYTPTTLGRHEARLVVSEGGLQGSFGVSLLGEALEVPVLSAVTATDATDITRDSYTANWTPVAGETVDFYIITRQIYRGSEVTSEEIEAEGPGWTIDGFRDSDKEAYSVQAVRLGYRSRASNVIFVDYNAGVTGVTVDEPLLVQGFEGTLRFVCSAPRTGVRVYDLAGMTVFEAETVQPNDEISLPAGVYIVIADRLARPVKVIVR